MARRVTATIPNRDHFAKVEVLVEYDGPRLAIFTAKDGALRIGSFVDRALDGDSWLIAPITGLELDALAHGELPMRESFEKDRLSIVDIARRWEPLRAVEIARAEAPHDALPVPGALLPAGAREYLQQRKRSRKGGASRRVTFDGASIRNSSIGFGALSRVTGALQGVWTALGDAAGVSARPREGFAPSALVASAKLSPGSFSISLKAVDEEAFGAILAKYQKLLRAAYDTEPDAFALTLDSDLQAKMLKYLQTLSELEIDAFFEANESNVYTGYARARVVHAALKGARQKKRASGKQEKKTLERVGHFESIDLEAKRFSFINLEDGSVLEGRILARLAKKSLDTGVVVGGKDPYIATFSRTARGTYTLTGFDRQQQSLF